MHGTATLPGISKILSAQFTLSRGPSPSSAVLEIVPQPNLPLPGGTLTLKFGSLSLSFPDCKVLSHTVRLNGSGQVVSLSVIDRRWKWAFGEISGSYNIQTQGDPGSFETQYSRTAQQLAILCLLAMGETSFDVSQMPSDVYPAVEWDRQNPAMALQEIAEQCGCVIVLRLDNSVMLAREGLGGALPLGARLEDSLGIEIPQVPDAIRLVGGRVRYQKRLTMRPVGLETDGTIKPIDDLSYKPVVGWGSQDPFSFANVSNDATRNLAKKSVWRWYQFYIDEGYELTGFPGWNGTVRKAAQILPLDNEQVETVEHEGRQTRKPAQVFGKFYKRDGSNANHTTIAEYKRSWRLVAEKGLIEFADPVYQYSSGTYSAAEIYLQTAFSVRDRDTFSLHRFERRMPIPGAQWGTGDRIIRHEDISLEYYDVFMNDAEENAAAPSFFTNNNLQDIDGKANYYLQTALSEYQVKIPQEAQFPGLVPVDLDGAIQQVSWSIGASGTTTRASRNNEFATAQNHPSYEQRLLWRKMRETNLLALVKQVRDLQLAKNPGQGI